MTAYYNEHDPEKAEALRHLMHEGWIAPGVIDTKDIRDVVPDELSGFAQCHFFAGIGLWSVAARAAGIPDDFPFWSGSCPCQPFSAAGAGDGTADDRHLWPHWYWLIAQCGPDAVVGEQVASRDGLAWLDLVSADMEGSLYAGGALDLCSAGVGAPNIRQRLYMLWLARTFDQGCDIGAGLRGSQSGSGGRIFAADRGGAVGLVHAPGEGLQRRAHSRAAGSGSEGAASQRTDQVGGMADALGGRQQGQRRSSPQQTQGTTELRDAGGLANASHDGCDQMWRGVGARRHDGPVRNDERPSRPVRDPLRGAANGFWSGADWLLCRDPDGPKLRPVEPGTFCLAPGYPGRTGELRGYGDAVNLQVATAFLEAVWPEMSALA